MSYKDEITETQTFKYSYSSHHTKNNHIKKTAKTDCYCHHEKNCCHVSENKKNIIIRCVISVILLFIFTAINYLMIIPFFVKISVFAIAYLIIGYDILWQAIKNIFSGKLFDENFLMSIATAGAFALGEYPEAVFVMLFSQVGKLFEDYAVDKSRSSIAELMNIRPDCVNLEKSGNIVTVAPEDVHIGDIIVVRVGEKVPLDGVIIAGETDLDTKALTGESVPKHIGLNESIISGCVNLTGVIKIRVEKEFGESTVSKILNLVENVSAQKAKTENFITRFARIYTPVVVFMAAVLATIPPLFQLGSWNEWIRRSLVFLIVSCPCALVISVPMGFFVGIGSASKKGILVKGSRHIEALSKLKTAIFDKTGTLTKGVFAVTDVYAVDSNKEDVIRLAALAENASTHPVALSICSAWKEINRLEDSLQRSFTKNSVQSVLSIKEYSGLGVEALVDGNQIRCGNDAYMEKLGIKTEKNFIKGTHVHVAENGKYKGTIVIADEIKPQSKKAIQKLKDIGIKKVIMLTGDDEHIAKEVASSLKLDEYKAEMLPHEKLAFVEELINKSAATKGKRKKIVSFIGDGINDAPVLRMADVGISMGALGSDAAIEASDVVLMDDNPLKIAEAVKISRKTISVVKQNIWFSIGVKTLVLILGAIGLTPLWAAVFADVGTLVITVGNSISISHRMFFCNAARTKSSNYLSAS